MRELSLCPGTPLRQRDGSWRFAARYEGWYALGPQIFDQHLQRFAGAAVSVLEEKDPQFELDKDARYTAAIFGKVLNHSHQLRQGIAESLALIGSHSKALTSCSSGRAEAIASDSVRETLDHADWVRWASLNDLLPLLAEAAPRAFLDSVEKALRSNPCPFDRVFAEEGTAFTGRTYITGLLWALETLAWDADNLSRVVMCLGELAVRDPGGRYSNRPARSLTTILLPWLPQTCAPVSRRVAAVRTLLTENPDVGWKLLVSLLPQSYSSSSGTRRPAWRETIPEEMPKGVTQQEYMAQTDRYAEIALDVAKSDRGRLAELIDHIEHLPTSARENLLKYLASESVTKSPELERLNLWNKLVDVVAKHRRHLNADWAMSAEQIESIAAAAESLSPQTHEYRQRRLFSERDFELYVETGNYADQQEQLDLRRRETLEELAANGGIDAVLSFAAAVQSPWRVGVVFGVVAECGVEHALLPNLLDSDQMPLSQFAGGFVRSRLRVGGWPWVDGMNTSQWTSSQVSHFLSLMPFTEDAWLRAERLLGSEVGEYWTKTDANPLESDSSLEQAIDALIQHGRPIAALRCIHRMLYDKQPIDGVRAVRALIAALNSSESKQLIVAYELAEVIKELQRDPATKKDDIERIEWIYLPLLDRSNGAFPQFLERRMATDSAFFCEVIRLAFRSSLKDHSPKEETEESGKLAANAYSLLRGWHTPPGCQLDGSYDGEFLNRWLGNAMRECTETGHVETAMIMIGHSLFHAPADPDGLFIHRSAAAALNGKDAQDLRDGYRTELSNSRGVHWVDPTGNEERKLADKYRSQAESIEHAGYPRLATTLREISESYERDAVRMASRYTPEE
jgi:hypothetical protein